MTLFSISGGFMHNLILFMLVFPAFAGVDPTSELQLDPTTTSTDPKFALSQGSTGDVNGDGYDDLFVASHGDDQAAVLGGAGYMYYGSPLGIDPATEQKIVPVWAGFNDQYSAQSKGQDGDINGDGFNDLAIGGFGEDTTVGQAGAVVVYLGSASGIDVGTGVRITQAVDEEWSGFGGQIGLESDVDADGFDDMVVGKYYVAGNGAQTGWIWVFRGSATGVDASTEHKIFPFDNGGVDQRFGHHVATGGDINGDGFDDIVVGSYWDDDNGFRSGSVYVYYGSVTGIDESSVQKIVASNGAAEDNYGNNMAMGDLNGDGYADIVVGAPKRNVNQGAIYIYMGGAAGVDITSETMLIASDAANNSLFGGEISLGDMDGDGDLELAASAAGDSTGFSLGGAAYVYGWDGGNLDTSSEYKLQSSNQEVDGRFGIGPDISGDFNGDGMNDLSVGSTLGGANHPDQGAAYVYLSVPTPLENIPFLGPVPLLLLGAGLAGAGTGLTRRED